MKLSRAEARVLMRIDSGETVEPGPSAINTNRFTVGMLYGCDLIEYSKSGWFLTPAGRRALEETGE